MRCFLCRRRKSRFRGEESGEASYHRELVAHAMKHSGNHDHDHSAGNAEDHQHHHCHHSSPGTKPLTWLAFLTGFYMLAEVVGGLWSQSLALIADAGHMAVDTAALILSLFAIWIAKRPPTPEKTFGYYRAEILAATVNDTLLVAIAIWIFYEAWNRFWTPRDVHGELMAIVSSGGLLVNLVGISLVHRHQKDNLNIRGVWLHLLTDLLSSVATLIAAVVILTTGWTGIDPIISVVIGIFILSGAWKLLSECVNVLLEGVPKNLDLNKLRNALESYPAVEEVHDLHVWTVTHKVHALSAHILLKPGAGYQLALEKIIHLLKEEFDIEHATLQLEPSDFVHEDMLHFHA